MDQDGAILVWESPSQLTSEVIRESYNKVQDELANTALLESTLTKIRFNQLIPAEVRDWQLRLLRNRLCLGNNLSAIQEDERDMLLQEVLQLVTVPTYPKPHTIWLYADPSNFATWTPPHRPSISCLVELPSIA